MERAAADAFEEECKTKPVCTEFPAMIAEMQALKSAADQEAFQAWVKVNGARMQELQGESQRMQSKLKELRTAADAADAADAAKLLEEAAAARAARAAASAAAHTFELLEFSLADLGAPVNTVDEC